LAEALEGCQWRRSSQVELFELGFWFWLCEFGCGVGKGARLAGIARVGVGGGGRQSHQPATACSVVGAGFEKKPAMVMAEPPKAVQAKGVPPPGASAVQQAVEKVKEPEPKVVPAAQPEEPEQEEDDVEELLAQHQELVDSMLAEVKCSGGGF
jgi:hypothetical protein